MPEIRYVNLASTTSGHAGSSADPYSWLDVMARFQRISDAAFDSGVRFDGGNLFDGSHVDIEFRLRGVGSLFTVEKSMSFSTFRLSPESKIVFTSDNPWEYGMALIQHPVSYGVGATAAGNNAAFMQFLSSVRLHLRFQNIMFDLNVPLASANWRLVDLQNPIGAKVVAENCVFVDRGSSIRAFSVTGADSASRAAIVGNTVLYSSSSIGAHEFVRVEGAQLFTGRNYAAQSQGSNAIVSWATGTTTHYVGGNAYGLLPSAIVYNGIAPRQIEADVIGLDPSRQGIWNPSQIDSSHENAFSYLAPGVVPLKTSAFWPVHGGLLLDVGHTRIDPIISLDTGNLDALGIDRDPSHVDAGAFQKTGVKAPQTVFVDLSASGLSSAFGSETDPLTRDDMVLDHKRRAPIDYSMTYSLRGDNSSVPIPEFDLGPLSPNSSAVSPTYSGAGSLSFVGWRTYKRALPVFSLRKIRPNASILTKLVGLKLEFAGSGATTNFMESDVQSNSKFQTINCVIRSQSTSQGKVAVSGPGHARFQFFGCSVHAVHSSGVAGGIFSSSGSGFDIELCAINLPNVPTLGSGGTDINIKATLINTGSSGVASWAGANFDSFCQLDAAQPFNDPSNTSFSASDFKLIDGSSAIGIAPFKKVLSLDGSTSLEKDARGLIRSAFPIGSESLDAGAYEHDFYVPSASHYYLDLGKNRSGSGVPGDRWSPADFQAWFDSISFVDREVVVHATRSGKMQLSVPLIDSDLNGRITVVSEQSTHPAIWNAGDFNAMSGNAQVPISVHGMILASDSSADLISLPNADVTLVNSILAADRSSKSFKLSVFSGSASTGDVIHVMVGSALTILSTPSNWSVFSNPVLTAKSIADTLVLAGFKAQALDGYAEVKVVGIDDLYLGVSPVILSVVQESVLVSTKSLVAAGCSVSEYFTSDIGYSSTIFKASNVLVSHTAIQGHHLSSSSFTNKAVSAASGSIVYSAFNEVADPSGVPSTGSVSLSHQLFATRHSLDLELSDFELSGSDLIDFVAVTSLPVWEPYGSNLDLRGRARSKKFIDPNGDKYDVGALERNYLDLVSSFDSAPSSAFLEVTDIGAQLDSRSAAGDIVHRLIGFVVGSGGYLYWDPTQVVPASNNGSPSLASVTVSGGTWAADSLSVTTPLGTTTIHASADFDISGDDATIAQNIAGALRLSTVFNQGAWCRVRGATLEIRSWPYGSSAVGYSLSTTGSNLSILPFSTSTEPELVAGRRWPSSGHAPWFKIENPDPRSISFVARLDYSDANGAIGELVAIAQVVSSPIPSEVGREYPYARVRLPLHVKHDREIVVRRLMFTN